MRCRLPAVAVVVAVLLTALAGAARAADANQTGIGWFKDFPSTLKKAKEQNLLVMVDFYTSWCVYCKSLDREAFVDPRVVELSKKFASARLDAEVHKTATNRYRPDGYPTIIFAAPTGDEILRISGYKTADQFYAVMKNVVEIGPRIAELKSTVQLNRKDWAAQEELGGIYLANELWAPAIDHLEAALKALPLAEKAAAPDGESREARIQFQLARANAGDGEFAKAAKQLQALIAADPKSPRCAEYYRELEKVYTDWEKPADAARVRSERVAHYPDSTSSASF